MDSIGKDSIEKAEAALERLEEKFEKESLEGSMR